MTIHNIFALIDLDTGIIDNIVIAHSIEDALQLANISYINHSAVSCVNYDVSIGDKYLNGCFWTKGDKTGEWVEINRIRTDEEELTSLRIIVDKLRERVRKLEEENSKLTSKLEEGK